MNAVTAFSSPPVLGYWNPVDLEYLSWTEAGLLFGLISAVVLGLGIVALTGTTPARRWVTLGLRLAVVFVLVLIIGGARWKRTSKDLEVMVLRDVSPSVLNVVDHPGPDLQESIGNYIFAAGGVKTKPVDDKYGEIRFDETALISSLPAANPVMAGGPIRQTGTGTDIAGAIQLGLATFDKDSMRRMVLISDGNDNMGDTDAAVAAAVSQKVAIDVMPLHYDIKHEVSMENFVAPTWKREKEPFSLKVVLKNTNDTPVTGILRVTDNGKARKLVRGKNGSLQIVNDKASDGPDQPRPADIPEPTVTLEAGADNHPSLTPVTISVPEQSGGVHMFHAQFYPEQEGAADKIDTMTDNNGADAFTLVKGKGRVLYVDNTEGERGNTLLRSLRRSHIDIEEADHILPANFPTELIKLHDYDAIILANVPYGNAGQGASGLTDQQQQNLATYVHDMGGGLVMIGGPNAYGAGGWQGKKLAEVLPVTMDIPAKRTIPKGALVLAMDPAEGFNGNYWGEQCALKAAETLSAQDDIGIISYQGGCVWDLPLSPKGDGSGVNNAVKNWYLGDLPSFEEAINLALDGDGKNKGLIADDARSKHIIVITDDDPQMPSEATIRKCVANHVTVSTITVFPHRPGNIALGTQALADRTGGRFFGPIEDNPDKLPQIFVKEATVVRRSLISEDKSGIKLTLQPTPSGITNGMPAALPPVFGMILTGKKASPLVEYPITAGSESDPLLATWQAGLGKVVCYMSDADNWDTPWVRSTYYDAFWKQVVDQVKRPPMSDQFDVSVTSNGNKGHIVVSAIDKDETFLNFSNISGQIVSPDPNKPAIDEHLVQTGPGRYEGDFDMDTKGMYVAVMQANDSQNKRVNLPIGGVSQSSSPEMRDLHSNDERLEDIRNRTGGRLLPAFDAEQANFFDHHHLDPAESSLPVWDRLIPLLLALILLDVAARRIAWDWVAIKRYAANSAGFVRAFTTVKHVETRGAMEALSRVRTESAATKATGATAPPPVPRPDPRAKFQAKGVDGDIRSLVGGATDKPIPSAPKTIAPKGATPGGTSIGGLMEAKRRAAAKIKEKEEGG